MAERGTDDRRPTADPGSLGARPPGVADANEFADDPRTVLDDTVSLEADPGPGTPLEIEPVIDPDPDPEPEPDTVLECLVTPERTRAVVSLAELHALHRDPELVDSIVQHLIAMRLVVIERGAAGADHTVELVHESLIDRWPTLVRWLDDNQDDAAMLARVRGGARDWERSGHAAGLLWTGEVAREAHTWRQRYQGELAPVEQRYLAAVLAAADRARRMRRHLFGGILATAVLAAIAMAWLAWRQTEARQRVAEEAMRTRDATRMAAMRALPGDPTTQLALLREMEDVRAPPPGAAQEAKRLLYAGVAPVVWTGHDDAVLSAAFSPDGRHIVFASSDNTVRVWNVDGSGEPLVLRGHDDAVLSAAFSPDGRRIVSASRDKTVRVWNADGRGEPLVLRGDDDAVAGHVQRAVALPCGVDRRRQPAVTSAGASP